jgi:hypothetical protein
MMQEGGLSQGYSIYAANKGISISWLKKGRNHPVVILQPHDISSIANELSKPAGIVLVNDSNPDLHAIVDENTEIMYYEPVSIKLIQAQSVSNQEWADSIYYKCLPHYLRLGGNKTDLVYVLQLEPLNYDLKSLQEIE